MKSDEFSAPPNPFGQTSIYGFPCPRSGGPRGVRHVISRVRSGALVDRAGASAISLKEFDPHCDHFAFTERNKIGTVGCEAGDHELDRIVNHVAHKRTAAGRI
jgi:hypothetical protein